ncbi:uncharacterized protein [Phaenicophaeus curvirostris]|uniref:uncharacterized protein n=1 Tax=Phaenicophaeus curvirostris TaxID=33595 RepID=UPI0037F0C33E
MGAVERRGVASDMRTTAQRVEQHGSQAEQDVLEALTLISAVLTVLVSSFVVKARRACLGRLVSALGSGRLRSPAPGQGPAQSAPIGCAARHSASGGQSAPGERPGGGPRRSAGGWFELRTGPGRRPPSLPAGARGRSGTARERLERGRVGRESLTTEDERAPAGSRPLPRERGKRRGGAVQASSVLSTMEPSHLSHTLAVEEEEGAHGETEAIAIQPKKPVQSCRKPGKSLAEQPCFFKARRKNLAEVLAMREPLRDPDHSPGRRGEATRRCPPGQQRSGSRGKPGVRINTAA